MNISTAFDVNIKQKKISMGDFDFYLVMDGYYRLDGGSMYGMVPKQIWEKFERYDERNRLYMAMNCLLVRKGDEIYLVDVGIGDKLDEKGREIFGIEKEKTLIQEMADVGVSPDMVTHVILTHMHFDHTGWIQDGEGNLIFRNARHYIQRTEWEEALEPHMRFKNSYLRNYYSALMGSNQLVLLDGDKDIDENVSVIFAPGHSKGHQIVVFDSGERKFAHFGDIVALASQVRQNWVCGFDRSPEDTVTNKMPILERAFEENWLIMSAHDRTIRIGELQKVKGKFRLKKIL
ncbi:MAG: MBL fold metallo-hydrolase [Candidatus Eremiobacteraeota bacterium]|nr:MBL fold metallo-hydrolase [Candidatus Eremiobacteraeota bacterium]